jgi:hypothetical protein
MTYVANSGPGSWYAYGDYQEWVSHAERAADRWPRPQPGRMPLCHRCLALGHAQPVDQTVVTRPVLEVDTVNNRLVNSGRTISFCKGCIYWLQTSRRNGWYNYQFWS